MCLCMRNIVYFPKTKNEDLHSNIFLNGYQLYLAFIHYYACTMWAIHNLCMYSHITIIVFQDPIYATSPLTFSVMNENYSGYFHNNCHRCPRVPFAEKFLHSPTHVQLNLQKTDGQLIIIILINPHCVSMHHDAWPLWPGLNLLSDLSIVFVCMVLHWSLCVKFSSCTVSGKTSFCP